MVIGVEVSWLKGDTTDGLSRWANVYISHHSAIDSCLTDSRDRSLTVTRKVLTDMGESVSRRVQKGPVLYRRDRSLTVTRKVLIQTRHGGKCLQRGTERSCTVQTG